jgi:hypothetical protein
MEEDEVESWYEEQKQKLSDDYLDQLDKKMDRDKAAEEYTKKFNNLNVKYMALIDKSLKSKGKKNPIAKISEKVMAKVNALRGK